MGLLKDVLESSIRTLSHDNEDENINEDFERLRESFNDNIGKYYIWFNHISKRYTLIKVVKAYDRYMLAEQTIYAIDKDISTMTHTISYSYLFSKKDTLYCLEQ